MNFKIVEDYVNINEIYSDLKHDYLNTNIPNEKLISKYGIGETQFYKLAKEFREEVNLSRRPCAKATYYTKRHDGYVIRRKMNNKITYYGIIPLSRPDLRDKAIQICEKIGWENKELCNTEIWKLKNGN